MDRLDPKGLKNKVAKKDIGSKFQDGFLYCKGLLYINLEPIQLQVLQACHDFPIVGHFEFDKIIDLISRDYEWN